MNSLQGKRRVLATDEWLRVKGCEGMYGLGDCATIDQRKIMVGEALESLFRILASTCLCLITSLTSCFLDCSSFSDFHF